MHLIITDAWLAKSCAATGKLGSGFGWRIDPITGRSTVSHLHFEILVQGIPQDPQKFLTAGSNLAAQPVSTPGRQAARATAGARAERQRAARR